MKRFLAAILAAMVTAGSATTARAAQLPQIVITHPSEGETLYAGPSTLIYSVEVKGWVLGVEDVDSVALNLQVVQDSIVVGELAGSPSSDGSFSFFLTVNPEGSSPNFTAPQVEAGCERCHFRAGLDLPSGGLVLRVSAMLPDGQRISQERVIDVDRSGYAIVPVRVVREDAPTEPVEGVVVEASGRLYEWRSRLWSATTDEAGMASIKVEALAQAPTRYVIRVAPGVREGMMVEATTSAELVLPPRSTSAPPVVLEVRLRSGVITGRALEPDEGYLKSVNVWAIDEGDLNCYRATTNKAGGFIFWDLPMGNYRVAVDPTELAEAGFLGEPESVDLSRSPVSRITLTSSDFPGPIVKGEVLDERGSPIPFSRISFDGIGLPGGSSPSSRTWWTSVSALPTAMVVSAPGYYSRSVEVVEGEPDAAPLEVSMVRRPETSSLKWGGGEVILPPESGYTLAGRVIELRSGWLWGSGGGDPISVRTPSVTMDIGSGSFAIELGPGSNGWLYVYDGTALLRPSDAADTMLVHPGEVARIRANGPSASATFCPILDAALADGSRLSIPDVWEPNAIQAQIDRLRNLGVSAAMIITLVTYSLGMLLLVLLPLSVLSSLRRRR